MVSLVDSKTCQLAFGIDRDDSTRESTLHLCGSITIRADGKAQPREIMLGRMLQEMFKMATNVNGIDKAKYLNLKTEFLDYLARLFIAQHTIKSKQSKKKRKTDKDDSEEDDGTSDSDSTDTHYSFLNQTVSMIQAADRMQINVKIEKENGVAASVANSSNYSFKFSAPAA